MKVSTYRGQEPGTAIVEVRGVDPAVDPAGVRFSIHSQLHNFLGPQGWQGSEAKLSALRVEPLLDGLQLHLGPEAVDRLDSGTYVFKLFLGSAAGVAVGMGWHNIPPSPARDRSSMPDPPHPSAEPPAPPAAADPPPPRRATPPPPPGWRPDLPPPGLVEVAIPPADEVLPTTRAARSGGAGWGWFLGVALLGLVLAGGGWWGWRAGWFSPPAPPAHTPTPLEQARQDLGRQMPPPAALAAGKALWGRMETADAAFLYLEYAAMAGQGEAALLVGEFFDPGDKNPAGSIIKDPAEAREWYLKARAAGIAEAAARLTDLRAAVARQAAAGDARAQDLLTRWQPAAEKE
ncbi:MAG: hypothetical protein KQJ78_14580 [Deltaproteobacteria bacterium]|nr:hypothetical protein [Deltaproteobacteria bacterium]